MPGLTTTGLDIPNLTELKTAIEDDLRTRLGTSINLLPSSVFSQMVGVMAEQYLLLWEAFQDEYSGRDPEGAGGILLDYIAALNGLVRLVATTSSVTLTLSLDATTTVPAGSLVSHSTTGVQFVTQTAVTSTLSGDYTVLARSVLTGPIEASGSTLTVISTPISGWTAVDNVSSATAGRNLETDAELRTRRTASLTIQGGSTLDAIVADVLAVSLVDVVRGFENATSAAVAGRPAHSFEVVLLDNSAVDNEIAQAIWDSKPAGIESWGSSGDSGTATDANGDSQTIDFTRAAGVDIYLEVDLEKDPDLYPVDGDTQVSDAILAVGTERVIGGTVYVTSFYAAVFSIAGVVNITSFDIGISAPASGSEVALTDTEAPEYDASRIVVNSSDE